jgi:hypothetical protein
VWEQAAVVRELAAEEVAFEIDGSTVTDVWSVVAKGPASRVDTQSGIDRADTLPLAPWIPTSTFTFVRITPSEVSGRAFLRSERESRSLV